jgi:hypothetical protein
VNLSRDGANDPLRWRYAEARRSLLRSVVEYRAVLDSGDSPAQRGLPTGSSTVAEHADFEHARADAATTFTLALWNRLDGDEVHTGEVSMRDAEAMIPFGGRIAPNGSLGLW